MNFMAGTTKRTGAWQFSSPAENSAPSLLIATGAALFGHVSHPEIVGSNNITFPFNPFNPAVWMLQTRRA